MALLLSGCMQTATPVATQPPRSDLDAMAYGPPPGPAAPARSADGGGAIAALRNSLASSSSPASSTGSGGGALAALRNGFSTASMRVSSPPPPMVPDIPADPVVVTAPAAAAPPPVAVRPALAAPIPAPAPVPMPMPLASRGYVPMPVAPARETAYHLDAGDKLRVVVFGQEGLTNTYAIDASGCITMPLIGRVPARGRTPAGLASEIMAKLRAGYIREPSVAVEVESYRPFFILGEVAAPGQYPYVPNMTVESAIAIAGGFTPRAKRDYVTVTHTDGNGTMRGIVPLGTPISPGDTVQIGERWF